jgi:hypothetical protein
MLPSCEKVKIFGLTRKGKIVHPEFAKIYDKNGSTHKTVKKEKEICASFSITPHTVKIIAIVLS